MVFREDSFVSVTFHLLSWSKFGSVSVGDYPSHSVYKNGIEGSPRVPKVYYCTCKRGFGVNRGSRHTEEGSVSSVCTKTLEESDSSFRTSSIVNRLRGGSSTDVSGQRSQSVHYRGTGARHSLDTCGDRFES